jgi:ABC-type sugar transport system ATPase subunit
LRLRGAAAGRLAGLDLELRAGEVLGLAGLENAGQTELLRLVLGDLGPVRGEARLFGGPLPRSPAEAWARGVGYVPRERRREALMPGRSITANTVLPHLARLSWRGWSRPAREAAAAGRLAAELSLRCRGLDQPVGQLSGGNQQKVVLARATLAAPRLLLLDEPTRGVDVAVRADVHAAIRRLALGGTAALVASSDLPEILALCDRVLVLRDGRPVAMVPAPGLDPAGLLSLIHGARAAA